MISYLQKKLHKRRERGNLRELSMTRNLIDFSSNDYLGLARSPDLAAAMLQEWGENHQVLHRLGSTGSRLLTGHSPYIEDLEEKIAHFHGYEAGLIFNCGYMANVGLLSAVAGEKDVIFFDAEIHASTRDGIRLSQAQAFPFRHQDLEHLENRLKQSSIHGNRFICIESLYSTDGSQANLLEFYRLSKQYEAHLIVDEAHAVGVCGPHGRGLIAKNKMASHVFAQITTFGKALGTHGAIVLGSVDLKQALINFAHSYLYTTALPFYALAAIKCSYHLFPLLDRQRSHIQTLIQIWQKAYPFSCQTHIQTIAIRGNQAVKASALKLAEKGFDVRPLMSPTVQRGREVLRVCLHAFNTENELHNLVENIDL